MWKKFVKKKQKQSAKITTAFLVVFVYFIVSFVWLNSTNIIVSSVLLGLILILIFGYFTISDIDLYKIFRICFIKPKDEIETEMIKEFRMELGKDSEYNLAWDLLIKYVVNGSRIKDTIYLSLNKNGANFDLLFFNNYVLIIGNDYEVNKLHYVNYKNLEALLIDIEHYLSISNKKSKLTYKEMYNKIRNELNILDPLGVVKNNPKLFDEYNLESESILSILNKVVDYKDLAYSICEIFENTTELSYKKSQFYNCSKNILDKWVVINNR